MDKNYHGKREVKKTLAGPGADVLDSGQSSGWLPALQILPPVDLSVQAAMQSSSVHLDLVVSAVPMALTDGLLQQVSAAMLTDPLVGIALGSRR